MDLNQIFVLNLKKWRKAAGISQKKLAEKCEAAHSYIRQLESGVGHPSFAFIAKIAEALEIEPYLLFYDESSQTNHSARAKYAESVQAKLLETVSGSIKNAFEELRKYQC